jgi:hypothetical protein
MPIVISRALLALGVAASLFLTAPAAELPAWADEPWDAPPAPQPLPVVVPTPDNWQPQFPFPFDQTRSSVTDVEINAEREMCQWFNAQYEPLKLQIGRLNDTIIRSNGNFDAGDVPQQMGVVIANIDQSVDFLTPRVQVLTQSLDHSGDMYFPLYEGDAFYGLWQQLFNVGNGLKGRQPTWFSGPSFLRAQHWGSKINRSHVCRS